MTLYNIDMINKIEISLYLKINLKDCLYGNAFVIDQSTNSGLNKTRLCSPDDLPFEGQIDTITFDILPSGKHVDCQVKCKQPVKKFCPCGRGEMKKVFF